MSRLLDRLKLQGESPVSSPETPDNQPDVAPKSGQVPIVEAAASSGDAVKLVRQILLRERPQLLEGNLEVSELAAAVRDILRRDSIVVGGYTREALTETVVHEIAGFGPLENLMADVLITDIMVNRFDEIYVEREGSLNRSEVRFRDERHLQDTVARILAPLGKRLDTLSPYVDARLPDGARLNVVIPPLATRGWALTIRRFRREPLGLDDLAAMGLASAQVASLLRAVVGARLNVLVSGGAGSGKTTLLNAMCMCIPGERERLVTIEDAQELHLVGIHHVSLESRPANLEGLGEITIRQLVRNSLRMRPDRLVIGEVRDAAAFDFLMAINTGHNGSMCTVHANSALDALHRMENLALTGGINLVLEAIRGQITQVLDVVIHLAREEDGRRHVAEVAVVRQGSERGLLDVADLLLQHGPAAEVAQRDLYLRARARSNEPRALALTRLARAVLEGGAS